MPPWSARHWSGALPGRRRRESIRRAMDWRWCANWPMPCTAWPRPRPEAKEDCDELDDPYRPAEDPRDHPQEGHARQPVDQMSELRADDLRQGTGREPDGLPEVRPSYAHRPEGALRGFVR